MSESSRSEKPSAFALGFFVFALAGAACGSPSTESRTPRVTTTAGPEPEPEAPAPVDAGAPDRAAQSSPPAGPARLSIHVEPGKRQPLTLVGAVGSITPPRGDSGLDAWIEVLLTGPSEPEKFYLLATPPDLTLPFKVGDRILVEIDCRKGGWTRVCDGVIKDMARSVLVIASGSGNDRLAADWKIERGPVATSEIRQVSEKSIEHTYGLSFQHQGVQVVAQAHEWRRLVSHGKRYLVSGFEIAWEGVRPPDATNQRGFAIVLER